MNKEKTNFLVTDFIAVDRYAGKNNYNIPDYDSEELKKNLRAIFFTEQCRVHV